MRPDLAPLIAAGAAVVAVWLVVTPYRLRVRGDPSWRIDRWREALAASGRARSPATRRREAELARAVPAICTLLAVCLEAGLPLRNAVAAVADASDGAPAEALRRLAAAERLGVGQDEAWRELGERHAAFAALAGELRHAWGTGVALAPVLRRHAREVRARAHAAAQERARRAGVTTVLPLAACFLPAFLLIGVLPVIGGVVGKLFG